MKETEEMFPIQSKVLFTTVTALTFSPPLCLVEIFHSDRQTTLKWTSEPSKEVT